MRDKLPVVFGGLAIILWGTLIVASRALCNQVGHMEAAALVYSAAMICVVIQGSFSTSLWRQLASLPRKYLTVCGLLFTLYNVCFYCAVGWASTEEQVAAVAIVNYLWPPLTIVLSVPILRYRAKMSFVLAGSGIAFLGAALAVWSSAETNLQGIGRIFQALLVPWPSRFWRPSVGRCTAIALPCGLPRAAASPRSSFSRELCCRPSCIGLSGAKWPRQACFCSCCFWRCFPPIWHITFGTMRSERAGKKGGIRHGSTCSPMQFPCYPSSLCLYRLRSTCRSTIWIASLLVIVGAALSKIGIEQKCVTRITMSDHLGARQ